MNRRIIVWLLLWPSAAAAQEHAKLPTKSAAAASFVAHEENICRALIDVCEGIAPARPELTENSPVAGSGLTRRYAHSGMRETSAAHASCVRTSQRTVGVSRFVTAFPRGQTSSVNDDRYGVVYGRTPFWRGTPSAEWSGNGAT